MSNTILMQNRLDNPSEGFISLTAARLCYGTAIGFLLLLALLHVLEPEFEPSWRFVSEYSNGSYGWVMKLAFYTLAICCFSFVKAIARQSHSPGGRIGLILLIIGGFALIAAGIFDIDPITASKEQLTPHGNGHALAAMVGNTVLPLSSLLISLSLLGRNPGWYSAKKTVRWSVFLIWASLVSMFAVLFISLGKTGGKFGPAVPIGWPNRLLLVAYCAWFLVMSRHAIRSYRNNDSL